MTTFKIVELPRRTGQSIVPHRVEIDDRILFRGSYSLSERFVQNRCKPDDIVIEQYPSGRSFTMSGKQFLIDCDKVLDLMDGD